MRGPAGPASAVAKKSTRINPGAGEATASNSATTPYAKALLPAMGYKRCVGPPFSSAAAAALNNSRIKPATAAFMISPVTAFTLSRRQQLPYLRSRRQSPFP